MYQPAASAVVAPVTQVCYALPAYWWVRHQFYGDASDNRIQRNFMQLQGVANQRHPIVVTLSLIVSSLISQVFVILVRVFHFGAMLLLAIICIATFSTH